MEFTLFEYLISNYVIKYLSYLCRRGNWFVGTSRKSFGEYKMYQRDCTRITPPEVLTQAKTKVTHCWKTITCIVAIHYICLCSNESIPATFTSLCFSCSVASGASGSFSTNSPASPMSSVSLTSPLSPFSPVLGSQASPTKQPAQEVSTQLEANPHSKPGTVPCPDSTNNRESSPKS